MSSASKTQRLRAFALVLAGGLNGCLQTHDAVLEVWVDAPLMGQPVLAMRMSSGLHPANTFTSCDQAVTDTSPWIACPQSGQPFCPPVSFDTTHVDQELFVMVETCAMALVDGACPIATRSACYRFPRAFYRARFTGYRIRSLSDSTISPGEVCCYNSASGDTCESVPANQSFLVDGRHLCDTSSQ